MIYLHTFTFNPFQENTYLVWNEQLDCIIIDPGCYSQAEKNILADFISTKGLRPIRLINTHCHIDHVLGNPFVSKQYNLQPEIHSLDKSLLDAVETYGHVWGIQSEPQPEPNCSLDSLDPIQLGNEVFELLFTPGHAPGHVCLYNRAQGILIAGDVLFQGSIGRTDLPGGDLDTLLESIRKQLFVLNDDVIVFPGHGPSTTIGQERQHNPFLT